jgi:uncharacterized protein YdeI (BOF family)
LLVKIHQATRLPIAAATVILILLMASTIAREAIMGDKSLKSKQRNQKQKDAAKAESVAAAKSKQDSHIRAQPSVAKDRK